MSRVNPLHIIVLLIVVVLFGFFKLSTIKSELQEEQKSYQASQKVATELLAYKKLYGDKKRVINGLRKIIKAPSLKAANIQLSRKSKSVELRSDSMELRELNRLFSKILNGAYKIKRFTIKSLDATHASVMVEIAW